MQFFSKPKFTLNESIGAGFGNFLNKFRVRQTTRYLPANVNKLITDLEDKYDTTREESLAILDTFQTAIHSQAELYEKLESIRNIGTSQTIYDIFYDDFISSGKNSLVFTANYQGSENEEFDNMVNTRMNKTITRLKLRKFIKSNSKEIMHKGDYYLKPKYCPEKQRGIISLQDNIQTENITPLYRGMDRLGFLEAKNGELETHSKHGLIHFSLDDSGTIKIQKKDEKTLEDETIDENIILGKGILYNAISEIKELELYRTAMIALDLKELLSPVFIMLGMSEKMTWQEGLKATKNYENMFTDALKSVGSTMMSVREMLRTAIRFKVLPSLGGKGQVTTLDISKSREQALERLKQIKKEVACQVGFPAFHILGAEDSAQTQEHKIATMKINARYAHKGISIQNGISLGIKDILFLDLLYCGIEINYDNLHVNMAETINVELIDNQEFKIAILETEERMFNFLSTVETSKFNIGVSDDEYFEYLKKVFANVSGGENLFIQKDKTKESSNNENLTRIHELYLPSKGEHQTRIGNFGRSLDKKLSWKTNRFNYMRGIKKFHRINTLSKLKKEVSESLITNKQHTSYGYLLNFSTLEKDMFLTSLNEIKSIVLTDYELTPVMEDKQGYKTFIEKFLESINSIENSLFINKPINEDNLCFLEDIMKDENTDLTENFETDLNIA